MGLGGAGHQQEPRGAPVQAVHDARSGRVGTDTGQRRVEGEQAVDQRGLLARARAGVHDQAGGLVDHVEVLVDVGQRDRDRRIRLEGGGGDGFVVHDHHGAVRHLHRRALLDPAVDLDGAGEDQLVGHGTAAAGLGRHPAVQALVGGGHQGPSMSRSGLSSVPVPSATSSASASSAGSPSP